MKIFDNEFNINYEEQLLTSLLDKQKLHKKIILTYIDKLANSAMSSFSQPNGDIAYKYLFTIKSCLDKVDANICKIEDLLDIVKHSTLDISDFRKIYFDSMNDISKNDASFLETFYQMISYSKLDFSTLTITDILSKSSTNSSEKNTIEKPKIIPSTQSTVSTPTENIPNDNLINYNKINLSNSQVSSPNSFENKIELSKSSDDNTNCPSLQENELFISEVKQCVVLPYTQSELDNILQKNNKYTSYQEIIEQIYTLPLSYYKSSAFTRFKEAFNLVKKRSKGSLKKAFNLAFELFFRYDLNPAIITACRSIDELNIYLSCLDDNKLDNFDCFKIRFEVLPKII